MSLTHVQFDQRWIKHVLPMHLKFITASQKSFGTCAIHILHDRESFVMTHVRHEYHIKVKKSEGAFKVIPTIFMHYYSGMLDSDLKRIEGQKESCMRTNICKHDLQKYSKMKNLMSSWKCNKSRTLRSSWKGTRKCTPIILHDLIIWTMLK